MNLQPSSNHAGSRNGCPLSARATPPSISSQEILWQELVDRHGPGLRHRLRGALSRFGLYEPDDLIEDLAQEVYRRLLNRHGKSLDQGPARCELTLAAYLGRAAESAVVDRLRYCWAAKRNLRRNCSLSQPWVEAEALGFPDPGYDPEQRAIQRQAVAGLIKRLRGERAAEAGSFQ